MTRATYGMLAGMVGSAVAFWFWNRQFSRDPVPTRGTVIFRNTPTASEGI